MSSHAARRQRSSAYSPPIAKVLRSRQDELALSTTIPTPYLSFRLTSTRLMHCTCRTYTWGSYANHDNASRPSSQLRQRTALQDLQAYHSILVLNSALHISLQPSPHEYSLAPLMAVVDRLTESLDHTLHDLRWCVKLQSSGSRAKVSADRLCSHRLQPDEQ